MSQVSGWARKRNARRRLIRTSPTRWKMEMEDGCRCALYATRRRMELNRTEQNSCFHQGIVSNVKASKLNQAKNLLIAGWLKTHHRQTNSQNYPPPNPYMHSSYIHSFIHHSSFIIQTIPIPPTNLNLPLKRQNPTTPFPPFPTNTKILTSKMKPNTQPLRLPNPLMRRQPLV